MSAQISDSARPKPLYTARVDNHQGTSGHVRIHDGPAALAAQTTAAESGTAESDTAESGTAANGTADGTAAGDAAAQGAGDVVLPTGPPRAPEDGLNPEQFLAMAWSTCLGETLRVVLNEQGITAESQVSVEVELHRDPAGGYRFQPRALVHIAGIELERARELADAAHARCPVSRLLTGQGSPQLEVSAPSTM